MRHTRERARDASALVRQRVDLASQRTVSTIKAEPLKAVMIAAAAGAIVAGIVELMAARPRQRDNARDDTMQ